jgi:hypothetical protein
MDESDSGVDTKKKPYSKPQARRFPLRPEEAVLGGCKTNAGAGPNGGSCRTPFNNLCRVPGS